jgi:cell division protein FtsQ
MCGKGSPSSPSRAAMPSPRTAWSSPAQAPWPRAPKVEGKGPLPKEDLLKLARAYPKAKALRYTPAGFWVVLDQSTLFAPEVRFLLEYAQVERPSASRVYLYSWGVSVRP